MPRGLASGDGMQSVSAEADSLPEIYTPVAAAVMPRPSGAGIGERLVLPQPRRIVGVVSFCVRESKTETDSLRRWYYILLISTHDVL